MNFVSKAMVAALLRGGGGVQPGRKVGAAKNVPEIS